MTIDSADDSKNSNRITKLRRSLYETSNRAEYTKRHHHLMCLNGPIACKRRHYIITCVCLSVCLLLSVAPCVYLLLVNSACCTLFNLNELLVSVIGVHLYSTNRLAWDDYDTVSCSSRSASNYRLVSPGWLKCHLTSTFIMHVTRPQQPTTTRRLSRCYTRNTTHLQRVAKHHTHLSRTNNRLMLSQIYTCNNYAHDSPRPSIVIHIPLL